MSPLPDGRLLWRDGTTYIGFEPLAPSRPSSRETNTLGATGELVERFELVESGKNFTTYSAARLKRLKQK